MRIFLNDISTVDYLRKAPLSRKPQKTVSERISAVSRRRFIGTAGSRSANVIISVSESKRYGGIDSFALRVLVLHGVYVVGNFLSAVHVHFRVDVPHVRAYRVVREHQFLGNPLVGIAFEQHG